MKERKGSRPQSEECVSEGRRRLLKMVAKGVVYAPPAILLLASTQQAYASTLGSEGEGYAPQDQQEGLKSLQGACLPQKCVPEVCLP